MMGHEILTKFVGTQFSQFGCPATERKKVIVNFCRIDTQKNLPLLIDAFSDFSKEHGEYELVIYGDGPEKKNIQDFLQICGFCIACTLRYLHVNLFSRWLIGLNTRYSYML